MAVKRKTYRFRKDDVIDVEEYHDGRYGAKGKERAEKKKPTKEDMQKVNKLNKERRARQKLLAYFSTGDLLVTLTYDPRKRPADMKEALDHFQKIIRKLRSYHRKKGYELFWIRNIERGTRGAWHIHIIINRVEGAADLLIDTWEYGHVDAVQIKNSKFYDEDFTKLANYITKDENTREVKKDGTLAKPKIKEASYNTSRNMPLPDPDVDKLVRWKKEPKPKKGYYIAKIHEGINPVTGYKYRRYTMIRLNRRI